MHRSRIQARAAVSVVVSDTWADESLDDAPASGSRLSERECVRYHDLLARDPSGVARLTHVGPEAGLKQSRATSERERARYRSLLARYRCGMAHLLIAWEAIAMASVFAL